MDMRPDDTNTKEVRKTRSGATLPRGMPMISRSEPSRSESTRLKRQYERTKPPKNCIKAEKNRIPSEGKFEYCMVGYSSEIGEASLEDSASEGSTS